MKYTFPSGTEATAETAEELAKIIAYLTPEGHAYSGFYHSGSRGVIKISTMDTRHLINATKKRVRMMLDEVDGRDLMHAHYVLSGLSEDQTVVELLSEIGERVE